jgi:glycosyltransferase involved in cell wall biosynthesis
MINLLVITTLYPNQIQFRHGIFVEARLRRLLQKHGYRATVIAPVPWFPVTSSLFPVYSQYANIPAIEERCGITIYHPRYLVIPSIGMLFAPLSLAFSVFLMARRLQRRGMSWDLIDAHYYYPDGVAAALVARMLGKPLTITARGSDINVISQFNLPRRMMLWAAKQAARTIAVSDALRRAMVQMGIAPEEISVLRNGVDLEQFRPLPKTVLKARYRIGPCAILTIGNLVELKGHDLVIRALTELPDCELLVVGGGELLADLEQLAADLQVTGRVHFLGVVAQQQLSEIYGAVDLVVLASRHEGMPNVVLEAMACDTPVVATAVGGVPEIVSAPEAGVLVQERSVEGLTAGIRKLLETYPVEGSTRAYAERFSWDDTIRDLSALFVEIVNRQAQEPV